MVFPADAFGAWLVEQFADATLKKVSGWILGSEQERSLRSAGKNAVTKTARDLRPSASDEELDHFASVLNQVFNLHVPDSPLENYPTILQALQARITAQISVLGDASLTETDKSAADILGVSVELLAGTLSRKVIQEIRTRGSAGGPLFELASQLNHDVTHLQGQQTHGMLNRLVQELTRLSERQLLPSNNEVPGSSPSLTAAAAGAYEDLGWPIHEADPIDDLEVHPVIKVEGNSTQLPKLPPYIERPHDRELREIVDLSRERSQFVVLVSDSSTGKTRALWEAVRLLPPEWGVWRPVDRQDLLQGLGSGRLAPRTVIWLNETQRFVYSPGDTALGEEAAAALTRLLLHKRLGPVLVVGTLWRDHFTTLSAVPSGSSPDPHGQARALLNGRTLALPEEFGEEALTVAQTVSVHDARLAEAVRHAGSRISQFLAGARELVARYEAAPVEARALINAAADAVRLGNISALPQQFLRAAAVHYIPTDHWNSLSRERQETWFARSLDYVQQPCRGVPGPLVPNRQPGQFSNPVATYRLADYLSRYISRTRAYILPPVGFWAAAGDSIDDYESLITLASEARIRGHLRDHARLRVIAEIHSAPGSRFTRSFSLFYERSQVGDWHTADNIAGLRAAHGQLDAWSELSDQWNRQDAWPGPDHAIRIGIRANDSASWKDLLFPAMRTGDTEGALKLAHAAAETGSPVWNSLVSVCLTLGDMETAERAATAAGNIGNSEDWVAVTQGYIKNGHLEPAKRAALAAADAGSADGLAVLARAWAQAHKWPAAIWAARAAAMAGSSQGWSWLADTQQNSGNLAQAITAWQAAANAGDVTAWVSVARLCVHARAWSSAARAAKSAIRAGDARGWLWLAVLRDMVGNSAGADSAASRAAAAGISEVWLTLGQQRLQRADGEAAELAARHAAEHNNPDVWRHIAKKRLITGDQVEAAQAWRSAAEAGLASGWGVVVRLSFEASDEQGALHVADAAAEAGCADGWVEAARQLDSRGKPGDAEDAAQAAVHVGSRDGWVQLCMARGQRGEYDAAAEAATRARSSECWEWLVRLLSSQGMARAMEIARLAAERGHTVSWRDLATEFDNRGDYNRAARWRRYGTQARDNGSWAQVVRAHLAAADFEAAERAAMTADTVRIWKLLALETRETDPGLAARAWEKVVEAGDLSGWRHLPGVLRAAGDMEAAERAASAAAKHGVPEGYEVLALAHDEAGDENSAENAARQAMLAGHRVVWAALADQRSRSGNREGARRAWETAAAVGAAGTEGYWANELSWIEAARARGLWRTEEELRSLRRWGIEADGRPAQHWSIDDLLGRAFNELAEALFRKHQYGEAATAIREAMRLEPALATVHATLGKVMYAQGRYAESEVAYHEAIRLDPSMETSRDSLAAVQDRLNSTTHQEKPMQARRARTEGAKLAADLAPESERMEIVRIEPSPSAGQSPLVLLREKYGSRYLPLRISEGEATFINFARQGGSRDRVRQHDLLCRIAESAEVDITAVRVTTSEDDTFSAEFKLSNGRSISTRLSDCIVIALIARSPIYAAKDIIHAKQITLDADKRLALGGENENASGESDTAAIREEMSAPWPLLTDTREVNLIEVITHGPAEHAVLLEEREGDRHIFLSLEPAEAAQIIALQNSQTGSSLIFGLICSVLEAIDLEVSSVRITKPTNTILSAQVLLSNGNVLNATPSDAITLALQTSAAIHVNDDALSGSDNISTAPDEPSPHPSTHVTAMERGASGPAPAADQPSTFDRFNKNVRQVATISKDEAASLGRDYIGTEHFLLAILNHDKGLAASALKSLSISYGEAREQSLDITGLGQQTTSQHLPFTPELKNALISALHHANLRDNYYVGTGHMLLGLTADPQNTAAQILSRLSGGITRVQRQMNSLLYRSYDDNSSIRPDSGGLRHYAPQRLLQEATSKHQPVMALCGWAWIPNKSLPASELETIPVCPRCKAAFDKLPKK